jgi:hypothetical protein
MVAIWTEGKSHLIADAIFDPPEDSGNHMALCYGVKPKDPLLHAIYNAAITDPVYQSVVIAIKREKLVYKLQNGHPGKFYQKCVGPNFDFRRRHFYNWCHKNDYTDNITPSAAETITYDTCRY